MSTRSDLLSEIVTNYVVVVSKYIKIYKMQNFVAFMERQVRSASGRADMYKQLSKLFNKVSKQDEEEIKRLLNLLDYYEDFID